MDLTGKRVVFISGRNAVLNGSLSIHDGNILMNIPNYELVFDTVPVPKHRDEFVYALVVKKNEVRELNEGNGEILRLWCGPKESSNYKQYAVTAQVFTIENPFEDDKDSSKLLNAALVDANTFKAEVDNIQKALQAEAEKNDILLNEAHVLNEKSRKDDEVRTQLKTQIADLSQKGAPATIPGLATLIVASSNKVLEAMPYIAGKNVEHLREWAQDLLNDIEQEKADDDASNSEES